MNRHIMLVGKAAGHGVFKGAALVGAFVIIVAAWWWDASLLTAAADKKLQLVKTITGVLPFDWGSKIESALRIFGADRALLLIDRRLRSASRCRRCKMPHRKDRIVKTVRSQVRSGLAAGGSRIRTLGP